MRPRYALWIGYQMSTDDFKELVTSIPRVKERLEHDSRGYPLRYMQYVSAYMRWRDALPWIARKFMPNLLRKSFRQDLMGHHDTY